MTPATLHPAARETIRSFPREVRRSIGKAIWDLQQGFRLGMPLSKSMSSVGAGVAEIRVKDVSGAYRAFYVVRAESGVIVFHAFTKKSQKTPYSEIELGRKRLKEMLHAKE